MHVQNAFFQSWTPPPLCLPRRHNVIHMDQAFPPPFCTRRTASDQELDGGKDWEWGYSELHLYWCVCLTPVPSLVPGPRLSSKPRNDKDPSSLRHAVDDSTGYSATPLAPTLAYVYPQLVSSATLAMNPAVAASSASQTRFINTKVRERMWTRLVEQISLFSISFLPCMHEQSTNHLSAAYISVM